MINKKSSFNENILQQYAIKLQQSYEDSILFLERNKCEFEDLFENSYYHFKMNSKIRYVNLFLDDIEKIKEYIFGLDCSKTFHTAMITNFLSENNKFEFLSEIEIKELELKLLIKPTRFSLYYFFIKFNLENDTVLIERYKIFLKNLLEIIINSSTHNEINNILYLKENFFKPNNYILGKFLINLLNEYETKGKYGN